MTPVWKICPINGLRCKGEECGWWCAENRKCAIASLPDTLDWMTRISATKPYEKAEAIEV